MSCLETLEQQCKRRFGKDLIVSENTHRSVLASCCCKYKRGFACSLHKNNCSGDPRWSRWLGLNFFLAGAVIGVAFGVEAADVESLRSEWVAELV